MNRNYYIPFSCCIAVKGASRAVICDLQRQSVLHIPLALYEILTKHLNKTIEEIKTFFHNKQDSIIDEYFNFLINNDCGFYGDKNEILLFPKIDLEWDEPSKVTNAILDIDDSSNYCIIKLLDELAELGCISIQIRSYHAKTLSFFIEIFKYLDGTSIKQAELLLEYYMGIEIDIPSLSSIITLRKLIIHSSPYNKVTNDLKLPIQYIERKIENCGYCGIISTDDFVCNLSFFSEAQNHNTCLNRKIGVDIKGNIKNCPSMYNSFGKVGEMKLKDIIINPEFAKMWDISKDRIEVCKDCEYRYVCSDCRAYRQSMSIFSKPFKCDYSPYTCKAEAKFPTPEK